MVALIKELIFLPYNNSKVCHPDWSSALLYTAI